MKLRIKGDSVRLRLGKSEVQRLLSGGAITESTHFPDPAPIVLQYTLRSGDDIARIQCLLRGYDLTVLVPAAVAREWATTEQVAIRFSQPLSNDGDAALKILIEKDFECLDGSSEDCQEDAFANPRKATLS